MIDLGERAVYVWASYGVSLIGLAGLALYAFRSRG